MDHPGLGGVIRGLELGDVDDMSTHAGGSHKAAVGVVLQLLPVQIGSFLLLPAPMGRGGSGAVVGAIKIGGDHLPIVVHGPFEHGALGPRDPSVGDEDIEAAVELFHDLVNGLLDMLGIGHVDLVRLACPGYSVISHRSHDDPRHSYT